MRPAPAAPATAMPAPCRSAADANVALRQLGAGAATPLGPRAPAGMPGLPAFRVHVGVALDAAAVPASQRAAAERAVVHCVLPAAHLVAASAVRGTPGTASLSCVFWLHTVGPHAVAAAAAAQDLTARQHVSVALPGVAQSVVVRVWRHTDTAPHAVRLIFKQPRTSGNVAACRVGYAAAILRACGYHGVPGAAGATPASDALTVQVVEEYLSDHSPDYRQLGVVGGDPGRVVAWVVPPAGDPTLSRLPDAFTTASGHVGSILGPPGPRPAAAAAAPPPDDHDPDGALRLAPARPGPAEAEPATLASTNTPLASPAPGMAGAGAPSPRVSVASVDARPTRVDAGSGGPVPAPSVAAPAVHPGPALPDRRPPCTAPEGGAPADAAPLTVAVPLLAAAPAAAPPPPPRLPPKRSAPAEPCSARPRPAKAVAVSAGQPMDDEGQASRGQLGDGAAQPMDSEASGLLDALPSALLLPMPPMPAATGAAPAVPSPLPPGVGSLLDLLPARLHGGIVANIKARWADGAFEQFGAVSLRDLADAIQHVSTQGRVWARHKDVPDDGVSVPRPVMGALLRHLNATRGRPRGGPPLPAGQRRLPSGTAHCSSPSRSRSRSPAKLVGRADSSLDWRHSGPTATMPTPPPIAHRQPKARLPGAVR
jgi:hypothetical protein